MPTMRTHAARVRRPWLTALLAAPVALAAFAAQAAAAPPLNAALPPLDRAAFQKITPEDVKDLQTIQDRVRAVAARVMPAVVGVRVGPGQGSGVVVSEDGWVLTAAHVSGPAGKAVELTFPDGRKVKGKTMGANKRVDGGLIKIQEPGKYPYVEMGHSEDLDRGDWCVAVGHPGGYRKDRTPPVRLGRVLDNFSTLIRSDCTLVGGDSGGPLFDVNGKVVGIHSRIGPSISYNIHVPVDTYRREWERLVAGDVFPSDERAYLGVQGDPDSSECKIFKVHPDSPAEKAGLRENDVIVRFADQPVSSFEDLVSQVARQQPGRVVPVVLRRGGETVTLQVKVGSREGE